MLIILISLLTNLKNILNTLRKCVDILKFSITIILGIKKSLSLGGL